MTRYRIDDAVDGDVEGAEGQGTSTSDTVCNLPLMAEPVGSSVSGHESRSMMMNDGDLRQWCW